MTRRVIIDSTAASPLRVSVAGVDAAAAEFNTLIFDGNQPPMRLSSTSWQAVAGMTYNQYLGGQNIREGAAVAVVSSPTGTTPIFCVLWKMPGFGVAGSGLTPVYNGAGLNTAGGGGGAICQSGGVNYFIPVSFSVGITSSPDSPPPLTYVNWAIFKNYT